MNADTKRSLPLMTFAAIGVVYGDIGTSPLYTLRECLSNQLDIEIGRNAIFGFLSLIFWLLVIIVSIKYITLVMQVDNTGEGGILTLMTLAKQTASIKMTSILVIIGLIGGSFFYGEVVITPAISVMSAIEGLRIITPLLDRWTVLLSIIILTGLFLIQQHGAGFLGKLFAPVMSAWFVILAILGLHSIIKNPDILNALNPIWILRFFREYKTVSFIALGSVVLSITGAEALYANTSHFGKLPIRLAWFILVFPSLTLNYFGQGALLLRYPEAIKNPFFLLVPKWALIPMIIISTLTTVIASQAVISGVFSLTRQAIELGYLFPMKIIHTSEREFGQIYIPSVNWMLYFTVVMIIIVFEHSSSLAAAYGIAVTGTMILTSILVVIVAQQHWNWNKFFLGIILFGLLCIDIPLFSTNFDKILSGGWLPLTLSLIMLFIMITWKTEQLHLSNLIDKHSFSFEKIISSLKTLPLVRITGTAVYMSQMLTIIPYSLMLNIQNNKVLHERVIILTLSTVNESHACKAHRLKIKKLSSNFWHIRINYGWCEIPTIKEIFYLCSSKGFYFHGMETSFFVAYETLILGKRPWYLHIRGKLYLFLKYHAFRILDQLEFPSNNIIELGIRIMI